MHSLALEKEGKSTTLVRKKLITKAGIPILRNPAWLWFGPVLVREVRAPGRADRLVK